MSKASSIFDAASRDKRSLHIDGLDEVSYVRNGIMVSRYSNGEVALFYVGLSTNDYQELRSGEVNAIYNDGWVMGTMNVSLGRRRALLEQLKEQLCSETEERMRDVIRQRIGECEQKLQKLLRYNGNS